MPRLLRSSLTLMLLPWAIPAPAQLPGPVAPALADSLAGLWRDADGGWFHLLDLRDLLEGRPVLSLTEYDTGRLRAFYPDGPGRFTIGPTWFTREPAVAVFSVEPGLRRLTRREGAARVTAERAALVRREVRIEHAGITLAGVLVHPPGPGPFPGMLMIPGSGPLTRRSAGQVGELVAAHGLAVLMVDKRGTGGSGGNWNGLSHEAWLADAEAQLAFLRAQPEVDPARVGIWASSEGGFVGPALAARDGRVAFLVCRVCSALPPMEPLIDQEERRLLAAGRSAALAAEAAEWLRRRTTYALTRLGYDSLAAFERRTADATWRADFPEGARALPGPEAAYWDRYAGLLRKDPVTAWQRLDLPALILLGASDQRILAERHVPVFERLAAGKPDMTIRVYPGASHGLFVTDSTGAEWYPPALHREAVAWIVARVGAGPD